MLKVHRYRDRAGAGVGAGLMAEAEAKHHASKTQVQACETGSWEKARALEAGLQ